MSFLKGIKLEPSKDEDGGGGGNDTPDGSTMIPMPGLFENVVNLVDKLYNLDDAVYFANGGDDAFDEGDADNEDTDSDSDCDCPEEKERQQKAKEVDLNTVKATEEEVARLKDQYAGAPEAFIACLFRSVRKGRGSDVVKRLEVLSLQGVNIGELKDKCYSLLSHALFASKDKIINYLLNNYGSSMIVAQPSGMNPLFIAVQRGKVEVVELMLKELEEEGRVDEFVNLIIREKFNEIELLLTAAVTSDFKNIARSGKIFKMLVKNGADLMLKNDSDGDTILHVIIRKSCKDSARESKNIQDYYKKFVTEYFKNAAGVWWKNQIPDKRGFANKKDAQVFGLKQLLLCENSEGHTPIMLAAKLTSPLFGTLCNWQNVRCFSDPNYGHQFRSILHYDVTEITSMKLDEEKLRYNTQSVAHIAVTDATRSSLLSGREPLKAITDMKWKVYWGFIYGWAAFHMILMSVHTAVTLSGSAINPACFLNSNLTLGNSSLDLSLLSGSEDCLDFNLTSAMLTVPPVNWGYIGFCILPLIYIGISFYIGHFMIYLGFDSLMCVSYGILTIVWFVLNVLSNPAQDIFLYLALVEGWLFSFPLTRVTIHDLHPGKMLNLLRLLLVLLPVVGTLVMLVLFLGFIAAIMVYTNPDETDPLKSLSDGLTPLMTGDMSSLSGMTPLQIIWLLMLLYIIKMLYDETKLRTDINELFQPEQNPTKYERLALSLIMERLLPVQSLLNKSEKDIHMLEAYQDKSTHYSENEANRQNTARRFLTIVVEKPLVEG